MSNLRSYCPSSENNVAGDLYHDLIRAVQVHSFKMLKSQSHHFTVLPVLEERNNVNISKKKNPKDQW